MICIVFSYDYQLFLSKMVLFELMVSLKIKTARNSFTTKITCIEMCRLGKVIEKHLFQMEAHLPKG